MTLPFPHVSYQRYKNTFLNTVVLSLKFAKVTMPGHAYFCVHEFEKARKMEEEDPFAKLIFRCFRVHFSRSSSVLPLSVHLYNSANGLVHS